MSQIWKGLAKNSLNFTLFAIVLLLMPSCDLFKPARENKKDKVYKDDGELGEIQGKRVFNPETGEWELVMDVTENMDTIKWKDLSIQKYPPITSDGTYSGGTDAPVILTPEGSEKKSSYNLALLLPFQTDNFSSEDNKMSNTANWAVHFYAGLQMAFETLESEDINLNVSVIDTKGNEGELRRILRENEDVAQSDVIIGPYRRSNVNQVSQYAKRTNKTVISPYNARRGLTDLNPNYVQVNPSLKSHCEAITYHVRENYGVEEVVLVARNQQEELDRMEYFQVANYTFSQGRDTTSLKEFVVDDATADFHEMDVSPFIRDGETTVFVVASYRDETFIYSLLRQIAVNLSEDDKVVVYGMPPWINYERIDFDFFEKLNVHISSSNFVDNFDPSIRIFKQQYFERYGTSPDAEAFLGFDLMTFCGRMLNKYGTKFQLYIDRENEEFLHTKFRFDPVTLNPNPMGEQFNKIDYFENKYVHILKFENYFFQPVE